MALLHEVWQALFAPFVDYGFMRRALVGCIALAVGAGPIGVFLILRRMALVGDAMAHAILPGAALGFLVAGLSLAAMTIGGLVVGLFVALFAGIISRTTVLKEDASLATFYLISLALGVIVVSTRGSNVDLLHVLFGSVLAIDDQALLLMASVATITSVGLAVLWRGLILECVDPGFLRALEGPGALVHLSFLALVVLNLVSGFHALGTLMVVGLMMLPAAAARFWAQETWPMAVVAVALGIASSAVGLLLSFHFDVPSGPSIILACGVAYGFSILFGRHGGVIARRAPARHLEA